MIPESSHCMARARASASLAVPRFASEARIMLRVWSTIRYDENYWRVSIILLVLYEFVDIGIGFFWPWKTEKYSVLCEVL